MRYIYAWNLQFLYIVTNQSSDQSSSDRNNLAEFGCPVYVLWFYSLTKTLINWFFQSFDSEFTRWRLLKKHVVCIKLLSFRTTIYNVPLHMSSSSSDSSWQSVYLLQTLYLLIHCIHSICAFYIAFLTFVLWNTNLNINMMLYKIKMAK